MDNKYNDVEITEEDKASLSLSEEEAGNDSPEQSVSDDQIPEPEEALVEEEDSGIDLEDIELQVGEETFTSEDIQRWMDDSQNKEDWQASNTQKAQELSRWNKLIDKVNTDEGFRKYMGDYFYDNPDELAKLNLDGKSAALCIEEVEQDQAQPELGDPRIDELSEKVMDLESDKIVEVLEDDMQELVAGNPDWFETEEDEVNFLSFCAENNIGDLTAGFMLYTWDDLLEHNQHLQKLQDNRERNNGAVVTTRSAGGPEQNAPRSYSDYKDMSMDDPDISKYFDK